MPVPQPKSEEKESEFISRCVSFLKKERPPRPDSQISAICFDTWRRSHEEATALHPDFYRLRAMFIQRYGTAKGTELFNQFVSQNNLDPAKSYNPTTQFKESFQWVNPIIEFYREDKSAKFYLVRCLTASISMNNNDYTDPEAMAKAASSLSWRPVNVNHSRDRWLPFPRTRVDFAELDDLSVEATLRVDNQDAWLQKMIDKKQILHPSIEARPLPSGKGYHFVALALLEKGKAIPGDPLTSIEPLFLHESVKNSLVDDLKLTCRIVENSIICNPTLESLTEKLKEKDRTIEELRSQAHKIKRASKAMNQVFIREGKAKVNVRTGKLVPWEDELE